MKPEIICCVLKQDIWWTQFSFFHNGVLVYVPPFVFRFFSFCYRNFFLLCNAWDTACRVFTVLDWVPFLLFFPMCVWLCTPDMLSHSEERKKRSCSAKHICDLATRHKWEAVRWSYVTSRTRLPHFRLTKTKQRTKQKSIGDGTICPQDGLETQ